MSAERRILQSEWMLNCMTVDIMLALNIVSFVSFVSKVKQCIRPYFSVALHTDIF